MNIDLKIIKKLYGEDMMHLCREYFSTILDSDTNVLLEILKNNFDKNKFLYYDIVDNGLEMEFKNYIYSLFHKEKNERDETIKSPKELLKEIGYELYECKTESDIQQFKKYYAKGEELCTFRGNRLDKCHVYFAVKKNVMDIKRENFNSPKRQDEYGTSVISIQFTKDETHTLSIKNRYNHTAENPDATFSNNLDNIVEGLTKSFAKFYGMEQTNANNGFEIPGYVRANDGKYYKYNYEINNIYYCINNVIIDNFEVKKYPNEQYIVLDYFILNIKDKTVSMYDTKGRYDSFLDLFIDIKKIDIKTHDQEKEVIVTHNNDYKTIITLDMHNRIIGLNSDYVRYISNYFLYENTVLKRLELCNLGDVCGWFLYKNTSIEILDLPNLFSVGDSFLYYNENISSVNLPQLYEVGNYFLDKNNNITNLDLPNLKTVGSSFLNFNHKLESINIPELESVENDFLRCVNSLKTLNAPKLKDIGNNFMFSNVTVEEINMQVVENIGDNFFYNNSNIEVLNFPELESVGHNFLRCNKVVSYMDFTNLKTVGNEFLYRNNSITNLNLLNLEYIGNDFLYCNEKIVYINMPILIRIGDNFLCKNNMNVTMNAPSLERIGSMFLPTNENIRELKLEMLEVVKKGFLWSNKFLDTLYLPNLERTDYGFLYMNENVKNLNINKLRYTEEPFMISNSKKDEIIESLGIEIISDKEKILK